MTHTPSSDTLLPTERLEQQNSYLTDFSATVIAHQQDADGCWLALDKSAFYPTSGGQLFDTGTLNQHAVTDVNIKNGVVWHKLDATSSQALSTGSTVQGSIDWQRRYRHMQRHTAQHLLSQAFYRINPAFETTSVSLSSPVCTIDFAGSPTENDIQAAEQLVNNKLYENLTVSVSTINEQDISRYPLRRPPKVHGQIRIVQIGNWEVSACGGTHLHSSAEAAVIKVLRFERVKGGLVRVSFCCGLEALEDYGVKHAAMSALALSFSAQVADVPERVAALRTSVTELKQQLGGVQQRLAELMLASLLLNAEVSKDVRVLLHVLPADDAALLKPLAEGVRAQRQALGLFAVREDKRAQLMFVRSDDVNVDVASLLKQVLPVIEGRGGGRAFMAQGAGEQVSKLDDALAAAHQAVMTQLRS